MNIMKLIERYDSDDKCRLTLKKLRWPLGVRCIRCDTDRCIGPTAQSIECGACGYHFSVTSGTIIHDSHLPLRKWFIATYLICESKKCLRAPAKATLGVAYKTAWYLCHRIREAVMMLTTNPFVRDRGMRRVVFRRQSKEYAQVTQRKLSRVPGTGR